MNKLCLLACLFVPIAGNAQTTPKVVFTGDNFTFAWQSTPQFTANHNWIGAGIQLTYLNGGSGGEPPVQKVLPPVADIDGNELLRAASLQAVEIKP